MTIRLTDTMAREKRPFVPADPKRVTMYVCGPTVYSYAHIGNARSAVAFDVLFRLLRASYGAEHVVYARNITDVDDRIIAQAMQDEVDMEEIASKFAAIYRADMAALGALAPTLEPQATAHIPQMFALIERLIAAGFAYVADENVVFDTNAFSAYGQLSKRPRDEQIAGARVEVEPYKRDPADFVLWKSTPRKHPGWSSPWGWGRPGWHLECSAMIESALGTTIDIHGGGQDLIFPHHENEIAQSSCAHEGAALARFWLHNGFLTMDAEKMSKSLGNVALVHDLLKSFRGEVLRFALLSGHYRAPLDWTDGLVQQSQATLDGWYRALGKLADVEAADVGPPAGVVGALEDDLNTPQAFAAVSALVTEANRASHPDKRARLRGELQAAGELLGLLQEDPDAWFKRAIGGGAGDGPSDAEIDALVAARQEARKSKNFAEADRIRDELARDHVIVEDGAGGSTWRRG
jgi:cysteinyl-tRNA synthetase